MHSIQSFIEDNKVHGNVVADRDVLENSYCSWIDALIHASTQILFYEVCCVDSSQLEPNDRVIKPLEQFGCIVGAILEDKVIYREGNRPDERVLKLNDCEVDIS